MPFGPKLFLGICQTHSFDLLVSITFVLHQISYIILIDLSICCSTLFARSCFVSMCTKANQTLVCPIANCRKGDGSARAANAKCKRNPPRCAQCCKLAGGCGIPSHQPKAALPLPSPLPAASGLLVPVPASIDRALMAISTEVPASSVALTSGSLPVPVIDPLLLAISTEVPASSLTLTSTTTPSLPVASTLHPLSTTPSSTLLLPTTTHTSGPTTRSYARPLNEHYARAYFEAHAKTSEAEELLKKSVQLQADLQSVVTVVVWVKVRIAI